MATHQAAASVPQQGVNAAPASAQQQARPFFQASKVGVNQTGSWPSQAVATQVGPTPLTASGGYLRRVILETTATGGSGAATGAGDYPFNVFDLVRYAMPNNTPILELSGYNLMLADCYGGYAGVNDPRNDPDYSANADNPSIWPFIPIALDETAMGALSDLSSSSGFQLTAQFATSAHLWGANAPATLPTFALTAYSEYWTLPNQVDMNNRQQQTVPPYAGTVQLWNQIPNVSLPAGGGSFRLQLNRMGNQLRTIVMVTRSGSGTGGSVPARTDTPFPNPVNLRWDDVILRAQDPQTIRKVMKETVNGLTARDTGVHTFPYSLGIGRFVGGNGVSSYIPTVTDTRYELSGTFGVATLPTLDWLVNDVSSAPSTGLERTQVPGGVAYYPPAPGPAGNTM